MFWKIMFNRLVISIEERELVRKYEPPSQQLRAIPAIIRFPFKELQKEPRFCGTNPNWEPPIAECCSEDTQRRARLEGFGAEIHCTEQCQSSMLFWMGGGGGPASKERSRGIWGGKFEPPARFFVYHASRSHLKFFNLFYFLLQIVWAWLYEQVGLEAFGSKIAQKTGHIEFFVFVPHSI
jgi:hypothetical protein